MKTIPVIHPNGAVTAWSGEMLPYIRVIKAEPVRMDWAHIDARVIPETWCHEETYLLEYLVFEEARFPVYVHESLSKSRAMVYIIKRGLNPDPTI